ncbi:MAG: hypothetical protein E7773_14590 [Sphingomonas sp.]|uniref:hypothetical protein n=1 Tax=Sphingomonas sp. TaxID=28214 RepID=UPI001229AFC2|nr:hypothetical protein [Sphingomonas sp.]THD34606.1 MAG: hypothetical protein E7773_14590 [Sphingomonas sp.]
MRTAALLASALLSSGTVPADRPEDLANIKAARSVVAEWDLIDRSVAAGLVSKRYAALMQREARTQLTTTLHAFADPHSPAATAVAGVLRRSEPGPLRKDVATLIRLEHQLEDR